MTAEGLLAFILSQSDRCFFVSPFSAQVVYPTLCSLQSVQATKYIPYEVLQLTQDFKCGVV